MRTVEKTFVVFLFYFCLSLLLMPNFFLPRVKHQVQQMEIYLHTLTNKKRWNWARKGVSNDLTLMFKSVAEEFKLNHKIGVLVNLPPALWESNRILIVYHIFRWVDPFILVNVRSYWLHLLYFRRSWDDGTTGIIWPWGFSEKKVEHVFRSEGRPLLALGGLVVNFFVYFYRIFMILFYW